MIEIYEQMMSEIAKRMRDDLDMATKWVKQAVYKNALDFVQPILNAYNEWQDDERGGYDRIYHLDNIDDVVAIAKSFQSGGDVMEVMLDAANNYNGADTYLLFPNEGRPQHELFTIGKLIDYLKSDSEDIAKQVVMYVGRDEKGGAYSKIWETYVTEPLEHAYED